MSTKNVRCATGSRLLGMIWTVRLRHQNIPEFLPKFLEFLSIRLDFIYIILPRNYCPTIIYKNKGLVY